MSRKKIISSNGKIFFMESNGLCVDDKYELIKEVEDDETFHIGQSYEEDAAKTIECAICGGREFNVGQGHCFTAIRCVKCKWEICCHEG